MSFEDSQIIDSQNGESILNLSLHDIRPPYPPPFITVKDFINKRESSSRIFRKSPNAFFIYRKVFTNYLTLNNYKLTMIDVSKLVSSRWKTESNEVKETYANIAKEIDVELKEKRKHDKKCPVIWKIDKKSKKQKRKSKKNFTNNSTNSSITRFRNTTDITFEFQNFSAPINNENDQKNFRSLEEMDSQSQSRLEGSSNSIPYPSLINLPTGIVQGCNFVNVNYDGSCESPSNESEEDNLDCQPTYNLNDLDPLYRLNTIESQINSNPQYNDFVYGLNVNVNNGMFAPPYNWDPCGNLACQQVNGFQ